MQPFIRTAVMAALAWVVIDGDTIRAPYSVTYRLEGYDAPETRFAQCAYERELGERATRRLEELMSKGRVRLIEKGRRDKYGRTLAELRINGRNVAEIMVREGLARRYSGGKRQSWCAK
jgi:micrococcal nuclease